jgi:hypothetical protein
MLRSYLEIWLGHSITTLRVNNLCRRLYNCEFEKNKLPNLEPESKRGVIYYTFLTTI